MSSTYLLESKKNDFKTPTALKKSQPCPNCNYPIGVVAGSKEAICRNCGFKDPCCE